MILSQLQCVNEALILNIISLEYHPSSAITDEADMF